MLKMAHGPLIVIDTCGRRTKLSARAQHLPALVPAQPNKTHTHTQVRSKYRINPDQDREISISMLMLNNLKQKSPNISSHSHIHVIHLIQTKSK